MTQREFAVMVRAWQGCRDLVDRRVVLARFWTGNPGLCAWKCLEFEAALDEYSKRNHGNGRADIAQMDAVGLLERVKHVLWVYYSAKVCRRPMRSLQCAYHGHKRGCRGEFEGWYRKCATRA